MDVKTSDIWGELSAAAQQARPAARASDGLIAATARRHGSRNGNTDAKTASVSEPVVRNSYQCGFSTTLMQPSCLSLKMA